MSRGGYLSKILANPLRWAVAAASALLVSVYLLPLWRIELWAPQYPEGLYMTIWINRITGDVRNINILNHYIGMRKIIPEQFAELRVFGPTFGAVIAAGVAVALWGRKAWLRAWIVAFLALGLVAGYDFYHWEYTFGHELSPDAPIKVEGMAYQPPLIGVRALLNISAWSLPGAAGYCVLVAALLACAALTADFLRGRRVAASDRRAASAAAMAAVVAVFGLFGGGPLACSGAAPEPIDFGRDQCASCRMTITDRRFGAELVTKKGKVQKFDSLQCLQEYVAQNPSAGDGARIYVPDAADGGRLIEARGAVFFREDGVRAPMGEGIMATRPSTGAGKAKVMGWDELSRELRASSSSH